MWYSENINRDDGVGVLVKEELCEKVVDVSRKSDRVMMIVAFEDEVVRVICGYAPHSG